MYSFYCILYCIGEMKMRIIICSLYSHYCMFLVLNYGNYLNHMVSIAAHATST